MTATNGTASKQLLDRFDDPQTANALNQLLDNAELIAFSATALDGLVRRSDVIMDEVAHSVSEVQTATPPSLGNVLQLLPQLIEMLPQLLQLTTQLLTLTQSAEFQRLLEVLGNPKTLEAIISLMGNMDKLSFAVEAADGFIQRSDTIMGNVSDSVNDARAVSQGSDFNKILQALPQLANATPQLIDTATQLAPILTSDSVQNFINSGALEKLLNSGILSADTIDMVGKLGTSMADSYTVTQRNQTKVGPLGLFKLLRDPEAQKALGLLAEFSKQFGQKL
ncbi:MAG TPA: DUF1641 domain-containing protein [Anaerolineae bacterium]|nr:DUF1641 domain-containing protein [Anaerolineae bacterium]